MTIINPVLIILQFWLSQIVVLQQFAKFQHMFHKNNLKNGPYALSVLSGLSVSLSLSVSEEKVKCVYDWHISFGYALHRGPWYKYYWQSELCMPGLLCPEGPETTTAFLGAEPEKRLGKLCDRMQKWGKRWEVHARLTANPQKLAVSTIILANVCSLDSKMDYIRPLACTVWETAVCLFLQRFA